MRLILRREWRLPGAARDDDRVRSPFVAPDAYPPRVTERPAPTTSTKGVRTPLPTDAAGLPGSDPRFVAVLDDGLRSLDLALSDRARQVIDAQARLLLAWNPHINLTAIRTPEGIARMHVIDSLAAVPILRGRVHHAPAVLDLGSGGGYPGLPFAMVLPAGRVTLLDSVAKKARFLDVLAGIAATTQADATDAVLVAAVTARAEQLAADARRETWDVVTVRAVGSLVEVVELGLPLLRRGGLLVCWKRQTDEGLATGVTRADLDAELREARPLLVDLGADEPEVVPIELPDLPGHRLVLVRKVRPTPRRFPRPPAERRRPLLR